MQEKANILLAEDDATLSMVIRESLEEAGYKVITADNGQQAIDLFSKDNIDICLLDIMMPVKDGFSVAKKIRQQTDLTPILFLTARSLEEDKIKGFLTGADDYITKPFSMAELLLRIEVFLRRSRKLHADQAISYKIGNLDFSFTDLKINTPNGTVPLTQKEAELLLFFCKHPNKVLKREEILLNVWGKDDYFLGRSMDVFVTKLRKHFKADPNIQLETIHGIGFRLNIP
ncbi:response regulator transcription factor [Flavihumibacter rivuli]|uniref:response regulator transcription factor n=1 Tax=Flavihumibacter rivuli TaxID=2838156 RepID=UPI001BDF6131|nr:response regulator transcription factor [Flavihumibacter rivuli]ULQ56503.1 response regulator transcription factor [Flavihumibacter rivuli]